MRLKLLLTHKFTVICLHRQTKRPTPRNFLGYYQHFSGFSLTFIFNRQYRKFTSTQFMRVRWNQLKPHCGLVCLSLLLAGIGQVSVLYDRVILGKMIHQ